MCVSMCIDRAEQWRAPHAKDWDGYQGPSLQESFCQTQHLCTHVWWERQTNGSEEWRKWTTKKQDPTQKGRVEAGRHVAAEKVSKRRRKKTELNSGVISNKRRSRVWATTRKMFEILPPKLGGVRGGRVSPQWLIVFLSFALFSGICPQLLNTHKPSSVAAADVKPSLSNSLLV